MLVLPHANGFRVDFNKLRQGVQEPPGDRYGAALGHIKIRELLRAEL
jgi:hypothetical protein